MRQSAHRLIQKLLILALLFLQVSLAFHHHKSGDQVSCDSYVSNQADVFSGADKCAFSIFYHANLAGDPIVLPVVLSGARVAFVAIAAPEALIFQNCQSSYQSRAPPSLFAHS